MKKRNANFSVVILTFNEEVNIKNCIDSFHGCSDIVVVDSFSTDKTLDIISTYGDVRVYSKKLINWSEHQNWINENIVFKNKWVYYSDADEIITNELFDELNNVAISDVVNVAYRVRYKNFFMGKWLKYSGGYPIWVLRYFVPEKVRWERLVNPRPVVDGPVGLLNEHFLHYSFNKGMDAWFDKHNKYSRDEALEGVKKRNDRINFMGLISKDRVIRRKSIKDMSFRLPARGFLRFFYQYVISMGFLDGYAGFHWCVLNSVYEYMIEIKIKEIDRKNNNLSI
jgi:glycosyltransferase involved in cell wall biosynthesis